MTSGLLILFLVSNGAVLLKLSPMTRVTVSPPPGSAFLTMNACKSLVSDGTPHDLSFYSVGDSAKNAFHSNPANTVFDAKRLIGRRMDDQDILRDMKHWPFKVVEKNGKPSISVKYRGGDRDFVRAISVSVFWYHKPERSLDP